MNDQQTGACPLMRKDDEDLCFFNNSDFDASVYQDRYRCYDLNGDGVQELITICSRYKESLVL
jgi:hypothetical protein